MFRFTLTLAVTAALVGGAVWQQSTATDLPAQTGSIMQPSQPRLHEGTVVSAGAGQVSLRAADGKEHAFKTNPKTRISVNGKPGKLEDLQTGVQIRVMVDQKGLVATVSTVDDRKGISSSGI